MKFGLSECDRVNSIKLYDILAFPSDTVELRNL